MSMVSVLVVDIWPHEDENDRLTVDNETTIKLIKGLLLQYVESHFLCEHKDEEQLAVLVASKGVVLRPPYGLVEASLAIESAWSEAEDDRVSRPASTVYLEQLHDFVTREGSRAGQYKKAMVLSSELLTPGFVPDGGKFKSLLICLEQAGVELTFNALVQGDSIKDAFKQLQDFKRVALDGAAFSVCLTRHTEAALAKLLMRQRSGGVPGSLTFSDQDLVISIDALPFLNHQQSIKGLEFCKCHGKPVLTNLKPEGKNYCSASRRRLEGLEVIHGYAVGSARVFVNDSIEIEEKAAPFDLDFRVIERVKLASVNSGLLFGEPLLLRGSHDFNLDVRELALHRGMFHSLCTKLIEGDEGILLRSTCGAHALAAKTKQESSPFGQTTQYYLLSPDIHQAGIAIVQMVASKELIKFPDDPVSMDQVELPAKLSKEPVDFNPLSYLTNIHSQVCRVVQLGEDMAHFQPSPLAFPTKKSTAKATKARAPAWPPTKATPKKRPVSIKSLKPKGAARSPPRGRPSGSKLSLSES